MVPEDIEADYWAHHFSDNPATDSIEDEDYDADKLSMETGEWEDLINE
jgi:hypothetical protein